jgi:hypothetical protein
MWKGKEQMSEDNKNTTLEQRIMKSNLSDDDKIELIQRLNHSFPLPWDRPIEIPCTPIIPNEPNRITTNPNTPPWWDTWYVITC